MATGPTIITNIPQTNSTTYIDLLGILVGLQRFTGETSDTFLNRVYRAISMSRGHQYEGVINEVSLQLGLNFSNMISISSPTLSTITSSIAGINISNSNINVTIPLVIIDIDTVWTWRKLSDIVNDINSIDTFTASLLVPDNLALQICKQSNIITVVAQPITSQDTNLGHTGIILGSESFSSSVPSYIIYPTGVIHFSQGVPLGINITYQYQIWPFNLVGSEAALIGMQEPGLEQIASDSNGNLVYQVRETIQNIMQTDQSYWSS